MAQPTKKGAKPQPRVVSDNLKPRRRRGVRQLPPEDIQPTLFGKLPASASPDVIDLLVRRFRDTRSAKTVVRVSTLADLGVAQVPPGTRRDWATAAADRFGLSGPARALLYTVVHYARDHRWCCYLRRPVLMRESGFAKGGRARKRYTDALNELVDAGLVTAKRGRRPELRVAIGLQPTLEIGPAGGANFQETGNDGIGPTVGPISTEEGGQELAPQWGQFPSRIGPAVGPILLRREDPEGKDHPQAPSVGEPASAPDGGGGPASPGTIRAEDFEADGDDPRLPDFRAWAADAHPEGWRPFSIRRAWETYRDRNPIPPTPAGTPGDRPPVPVCDECGVAVGRGHAASCSKAYRPPTINDDPEE